jgi:phosphate-selective porin
LDVALSPSLDLSTEYDIDPEHGRVRILDLRLDRDLSQWTYLSLGRYKVPFGWEGLRSSRTTNTIERSDMTSALYAERDAGFSLTHRQPDLGHVSIGTFLGQGRSQGDSNGGLDVIGRGVLQLSDDLRLGASGHLGTFRISGSSGSLPVRRIGTDVQFRSGPFRLEAEAIWSDGYNTMSQASTRASGYYLSGLYGVAESLDLVLHYDRFDPDMQASDAGPARNATNARDRKVVGLNYLIEGDVAQRFMLNYEWRSELEGGHARNSGFRARYQIAW